MKELYSIPTPKQLFYSVSLNMIPSSIKKPFSLEQKVDD